MNIFTWVNYFLNAFRINTFWIWTKAVIYSCFLLFFIKLMNTFICSDVVTLCMQVWSCDLSCGKSKIFLVEFNNYHMRVTSFYSYKYDILNPYLKHLYRWTPVPFKYRSITVDIFRLSKWLFHFNDKILFLYNNRF